MYWLCWVFVSVRGLSPVAASGGHSSSRCADLVTGSYSLHPHQHLVLSLVFFCFCFDKFIYYFIYLFWLHWVFVAVHGLSLVAASGGHFVEESGPLIAVASLVVEHGLQSCGLQ